MKDVTAILLFLLVESITGDVCPPPFHKVSDGCFYVDTQTSVQWHEARQLCRTIGGDYSDADLAVFPSCDTFSAFAGYMGFNVPSSSSFWVGAHTEFTPNNWRWLNGEALPTGVPYWSHTEGSDDVQDCAAMDSSSYFQLSDFPCDEPRFFVCSLSANSGRAVRDDPPVVINCPSDSLQVGDFCYWFSTSSKSWSSAEDYCRTHFSYNHGELFSPSSCEEFTMMAHHLEAAERDRSRWVGATDVSGNQEWFWVNGEPVPGGSPFWATGMPEDHLLSGSRDFCGIMDNKKRFYLSDSRCTNLHNFICKLHVV